MMFRPGYVYTAFTSWQASCPAPRLHSRRTYHILSFLETLQPCPRVISAECWDCHVLLFTY